MRNRFPLFALTFAAVLAAGAAEAQDRLSIGQNNPSMVRTFALENGHLVRGSSAAGGVDPSTFAVTNRFVALGTELFTGSGVELPGIETSAPAAAPAMAIASQDGLRLYYVYTAAGSPPFLSVVDLDPASPTFRREIGLLQLSAVIGLQPTAVQVSGNRLYAAFSGQPRIVLADPGSMTKIAEVAVPVSAIALRLGIFGGQSVLLTSSQGGIRTYPVDAAGVPSVAGSLQLTLANMRLFDLAIDAGGSGLVYATVKQLAPGSTTVVGEAVCAVSLAGSGAALSISQQACTVTSGGDITPSSDDGERIFASGSTLFVVDSGISGATAAHVIALAANGPAAPQVIDTIRLDDTPGIAAAAVGAVLHSELPSSEGPAVIDTVLVDGAPGVAVNDAAHLVTIRGSGLGQPALVGIGLSPAVVVSSSDDEIGIEVPALTPAGTTPVTVLLTSGATVQATLVVANAPTNQPPYVTYADSLASNSIAVLHAATKTRVTSTFPTGQGPTELLVSPDGRLLFASDFRGTTLTVHTLIADYPTAGLTFNQRIAAVSVGRNPQQIAADWSRGRLYVSSVTDRQIAVVDVDPASPTFLTRIATIPTGTDGARGLAMTADGRYLYAARGRAPFLLVIDTLSVSPIVTPCPTIPGAALPATPIRIDGLALSADDGTLYFSANTDAYVRVMSLSPGGCPGAEVAQIDMQVPSVRRVIVHPTDGRVFVSSVAQGSVSVFNPQSPQDPIVRIPTGLIRTGSGRPSLTPDGQFLFMPGASVATVDVRPGSASIYTVIARTTASASTTSVAVSPGLLTPAGTSVTLRPLPGMSITFPEVASPGHTTVTAANVSDVPVAAGFRLDAIPVFYEIKTSAGWMSGGPAMVCLDYDDTGLTLEDEQRLRLLHEENGVAVDRTASRDTAGNVICAALPGFSQVVPASVIPSEPVLVWPSPSPIHEGTPIGPAELNATASTAGIFTYTPPAGTLLEAGEHVLSVSFVPDDGASYLVTNATVTITVVPTAGRMSGEGHLETDDVRYAFEFQVRERASGAESGQFMLRRELRRSRTVSRDRFEADTVSSVIFSDALDSSHRHEATSIDSVVFRGTGRWNGTPGFQFSVRAVDAGEPGRRRDRVTIVITAPDGAIVASVEGAIDGGNIQATRLPFAKQPFEQHGGMDGGDPGEVGDLVAARRAGGDEHGFLAQRARRR